VARSQEHCCAKVSSALGDKVSSAVSRAFWFQGLISIGVHKFQGISMQGAKLLLARFLHAVASVCCSRGDGTWYDKVLILILGMCHSHDVGGVCVANFDYILQS
jgi:hypothetical protein